MRQRLTHPLSPQLRWVESRVVDSARPMEQQLPAALPRAAALPLAPPHALLPRLAKVGDNVPHLGGKPRYTVYSLKGCIWTGSKKSAEYKKLLLGNDSRALDELAASALKS